MSEHWFWLILAIVCTVWYSTITIYVAYRGWHDIRNMFRDLGADHRKREVHK
jgi:hypothetical protein